MIEKAQHPLAFDQLVFHLQEAQEHIGTLVVEMCERPDYGEEEFAIDIGHLYAHINRVWNCRNSEIGMNEENWEEITCFPTDVRPVG